MTIMKILFYCFSLQTYLQLLDMGSYDTTKYSKVEDLGGEDAEPSARPLRNAAAKRLGKWASDRR